MVGNITGWNELTQGSMGTAVFLSLDAAFGGFFSLIIFLVIQGMIYLRTKNYPITASIAIILYAMFVGVEVTAGNPMFGDSATNIIGLITLFETAGAIYYLVAK